MGYEIPAAIGVRLADPDPAARVVSFLGDGTFLMAPTELVTAAAEGLAVTLVVPDNHGYQVIHRLQMLRSGREFGNEFRYRPGPLQLAAGDGDVQGAAAGGRLPPPGPGPGRRRARRPRLPRDHRGRTAGRAGRHARSPRPGRDRGAGHPARRPARRRGLVGRRPSRGLHPGGHQRPARRVRDRPGRPAVVRMSISPLNEGALAAAVGDPALVANVLDGHCRFVQPPQRRPHAAPDEAEPAGHRGDLRGRRPGCPRRAVRSRAAGRRRSAWRTRRPARPKEVNA